MTRFLNLTTALAMLALSAPAAQARIAINGPALDGRQVVLPDGLRIVGAPVEEVRGVQIQGPALDGRQVVLPDGLRIVGAPLGRIPELPRKD
jgi:hypothetical protein